MLRDTPEMRWGVLLVLLTTAMLLEPIFGESLLIELAGLALFQLVVVSALFSSIQDSRGRGAGLVLALVWFASSLLALFHDGYHGLVAGFSAALLAGSLIVTFRNLLDRESGDAEALVGAIFGFVLLAMAWAMLYVQIEHWHPGAIAFTETSGLWSSSVYFSLVTLTSLGYGDILPVDPLARIAAGLEAVVGVLYIAIMIGRIVGTYRNRP